MRALLCVFRKEFLENLRDRRTLLSALLFGPLFGPLLFAFIVTRTVDQSVTDTEVPLRMTVSGAARAPTLTAFLESQGAQLTRVELNEPGARAVVSQGGAQMVLWVPPDYAERFREGRPAPLLLFADSSDSQGRKHVERAKILLAGFGSQIAQLRLQLYGLDPSIVMPLAVDDVDVATPAGRAVVVLGFMTYFVLFALLMGGLYLAIDSTAGERERGSLEALLTLPVARASLIGGKLLATCAYMGISLAITLAAFVVAFRFVPLEKLGMSSNLGWLQALQLFAVCLPFVPLGAALMSFVASFTRSYREAQTWLTAVLLVPTLPIAFASIYSLKSRSSLMPIPSLSQHLLMTDVLRGQTPSVSDMLVSGLVSLLLAALLFALTARHWRRESMLG
ncbi:MAG: ABC transporter permease [Proteobacteria bacterium]|nr:ABC transporter permease [Pseudomonadota bacterium]